MNQSPRYINVIETVEVNGCFLEEQRSHEERRKTLKVHIKCYERRSRKHRRYLLQFDIQV